MGWQASYKERTQQGQGADRTNFESGYEAFDAEFLRVVQVAVRKARAESFRLGLSVFYTDAETGHHMMEQPDGRRFLIEFIPGASREENCKIIKEIDASE